MRYHAVDQRGRGYLCGCFPGFCGGTLWPVSRHGQKGQLYPERPWAGYFRQNLHSRR